MPRELTLDRALQALSNNRRLQILEWLKQPKDNFAAQVCGDLVKDGVCGQRIAEKLRVGQPTASEHLRILVDAGFLKSQRMRQWTFYRRDEGRIREFKRSLQRTL